MLQLSSHCELKFKGLTTQLLVFQTKESIKRNHYFSKYIMALLQQSHGVKFIARPLN